MQVSIRAKALQSEWNLPLWGGREGGIGIHFWTQREALGIKALPGRVRCQHGASLLATSPTMTLAVEQSPIFLVLWFLGVKRSSTSHFSLVWCSILLCGPKFRETDYCLREEGKRKHPSHQILPSEYQPRCQEEEKERVSWLGRGR